MNILELARLSLQKIKGGQKPQAQNDGAFISKCNEKNELNEEELNAYRLYEQNINSNVRRFTKATDPYRKAGGRNYWKLQVPASQRPAWVKEIYGLD